MILISEVGPRDGLQSIDRVMPTEAKKAWIVAEAAAGVREIEVGSFVPVSLLPQYLRQPLRSRRHLRRPFLSSSIRSSRCARPRATTEPRGLRVARST